LNKNKLSLNAVKGNQVTVTSEKRSFVFLVLGHRGVCQTLSELNKNDTYLTI